MIGTPVSVFDSSKSFIIATGGSVASFNPDGDTATSGSMAWNGSVSYNKNTFVSYEGKLYISKIDGNINHCPSIEPAYWDEFSNVDKVVEITENTDLIGGKSYICTSEESLELTLPKGYENASVVIFAQQINSNSHIKILPYKYERIMGQEYLLMETSFSSVKLLWMSDEWKVVAPFVPEMFQNVEVNNPSGLEEYVNDTSTNVDLSNIDGGKVYRFTQPLDSFVLENIDYNINESIILFKTSENASSLQVPVDKITNHQGTQIPLFTNKNYILSIQVGYLTYVIMD